MSTDFDLPPQVPPKPRQSPSASRAQQSGPTSQERRVKGMQGGQGEWVATRQQRHEKRGKTINKTRNGGGFNPSVNPSLSINIQKGSGGANQAGGPGPAAGGGSAGTPGSAFMSNEDIHKFSEHIRKEGRKRAGERAMDAEQLEQVLRHIPDSTGSLVGARMRARRVSRHLKRIAKAEQLIAKEATAVYASFEREYEAELRKVGRGRPAQQPRTAFGWR